ncbi:unnamed protein product [Spirodela intermedia]|uniref:Uncharacterized protein n=1 Tax=Spirodela intermedia TaxID=51605 RepID=A0A7I8L0B0_SPIIN|nr:unnamed protein product [Spirodela intermedia]
MTSSASSIAFAKGTAGRPGERQPGSTPKIRLQMVSKVSRRNTSCRSTTVPFSATWARRGTSPFSTLS